MGEEGWQEDLIVGELTEGVCSVRIVRVWEVLGWGGVGSVLCEGVGDVIKYLLYMSLD